ncbi:MAG TPA: CvpA family protein [Rhizomicrobium sp.]|nr:CvpA family protein [Rhizomicrobium sp.]
MSLSVTFIDCLIVLVIVVSAGYAAWRGFIWETLTIFAWAAAALACLYFGPYIIPLARSLVSQTWLANLIAYAAVFLAVFSPFAFISHRFSEGVKHSPIGPLDRAAGVAFGVVRGLVIVALAYLAFTYFVPIRQQPHWVTEAKLIPMVESTADVMLSVVPNQPHDYGYLPQHQEEIRQAPPQVEQNARAQPPVPAAHDPMAELIRKNERANTVPKSAKETAKKTVREPVLQKSAAKGEKTYGASDRQALDRLVQTGGAR